jgi:hypothetical protein
LVLRLNGDRSISASILTSEVMSELIKQNKSKLGDHFKKHNLSLREFNTYRSELELNSESGAKRQKRKKGSASKGPGADIL